MNQQIMDFNPDSMALEGTKWWKPDGSDHFTIRDVLMAPEGMSIRTTDGRILDGGVMETYVQSDEPIHIPTERPTEKLDLSNLDPDTPVQQVGETKFGSLKNSHPGVQFKEDTRHHGIPHDPINDPLPGNPEPTSDIDPVELAMIERVLGKASFDCIHVDVQDDGTIMNGISTLHEVLNVKKENIEKYLTKRILENLNNVAATATQQLMEVIP